MQGINIFSGEVGLGGALTNPTEIARRKGTIDRGYPVRYRARDWSDVESAYHALKSGNAAECDALMIDLIEAKFRQHPDLVEAVNLRGGRQFLLACSHFTNAKSDAGGWEGQGRGSRFIRNLVAGFDRLAAPFASEAGQGLLF